MALLDDEDLPAAKPIKKVGPRVAQVIEDDSLPVSKSSGSHRGLMVVLGSALVFAALCAGLWFGLGQYKTQKAEQVKAEEKANLERLEVERKKREAETKEKERIQAELKERADEAAALEVAAAKAKANADAAALAAKAPAQAVVSAPLKAASPAPVAKAAPVKTEAKRQPAQPAPAHSSVAPAKHLQPEEQRQYEEQMAKIRALRQQQFQNNNGGN